MSSGLSSTEIESIIARDRSASVRSGEVTEPQASPASEPIPLPAVEEELLLEPEDEEGSVDEEPEASEALFGGNDGDLSELDSED